MLKLNKQDFMFIGGALLFIALTAVIYYMTRWYFVDTCFTPQEGDIGYALNVRYTRDCFGYGGFFDRYSFYLYILFLWITIVPYMKRKYLFPNNIIYVAGVLIFMLLIFYTYRVTPTDFSNGLPLKFGH